MKIKKNDFEILLSRLTTITRAYLVSVQEVFAEKDPKLVLGVLSSNMLFIYQIELIRQICSSDWKSHIPVDPGAFTLWCENVGILPDVAYILARVWNNEDADSDTILEAVYDYVHQHTIHEPPKNIEDLFENAYSLLKITEHLEDETDMADAHMAHHAGLILMNKADELPADSFDSEKLPYLLAAITNDIHRARGHISDFNTITYEEYFKLLKGAYKDESNLKAAVASYIKDCSEDNSSEIDRILNDTYEQMSESLQSHMSETMNKFHRQNAEYAKSVNFLREAVREK